jgi:hypothetical protein
VWEIHRKAEHTTNNKQKATTFISLLTVSTKTTTIPTPKFRPLPTLGDNEDNNRHTDSYHWEEYEHHFTNRKG